MLRRNVAPLLFALVLCAMPVVTMAQDDSIVPGVARPGGVLPSSEPVQLVKIADGLADPIDIENAGDGSGRLFVVERIGDIRVIGSDGSLLPESFLDLRTLVRIGSPEQGLLGLAFHPGGEGGFYVSYTNTDNALVIAHYATSSDDPNVADAASAQLILVIPHEDRVGIHNGGRIRFGPDGFLYIAVGNGASIEGGDPANNSQNLGVLPGKLLRIDIDQPEGDLAYGIPDDNPFVETAGARPEIWALGLRNPWEFEFDAATGDLWITDVGQEIWEEIDFAAAGGPGGANYGWVVMEGAHCYPTYPMRGEGYCDEIGTLPVAEYNHYADGFNGCAAIGIGVYHGTTLPKLGGVYLLSDLCAGNILGIARDGSDVWVMQQLFSSGLRVSGSGVDESGELYVTSCQCNFDDPSAIPVGAVWKMVPAGQIPAGAELAPTPES